MVKALPQQTNLKEHQKTILMVALVSVVLWAVPVLGLITLPIQYLNTYVHEICHALTALVTGGHVQMIEVFGNGGGVTPVIGGMTFLTASAGYIGAALVGAGLILLGRTAKGAQLYFRVMALLIAIALVLWVRGDFTGVIVGLVWVSALFLASAKLGPSASVFAAQFLGLQLCLQSFQSLLTLLHISAFSSGHSDAMLMAEMTHLPAIVWAVLWASFSVVAVFAVLKAAWKSPVPSQ